MSSHPETNLGQTYTPLNRILLGAYSGEVQPKAVDYQNMQDRLVQAFGHTLPDKLASMFGYDTRYWHYYSDPLTQEPAAWMMMPDQRKPNFHVATGFVVLDRQQEVAGVRINELRASGLTQGKIVGM